MADKGIIFSGPMVRALLAGTKTQTRRLLTLRGHRKFSEFGPSNTPGYDWHFRREDGCWCDHRTADLPLPYAPGDRLYVREAHAYVGTVDPGWLLYRASGYEAECQRHGFDEPYPPQSMVRWTPSIHMPRRLSRLWLAVTDVRLQRLQDISEADAVAEGIDHAAVTHFGAPSRAYAALWNHLHGAENDHSWEANPWIVAITFTVNRGSIDG